MHKQHLLSKIFVPDMDSDELVPFGLEHVQHLCRYLAWDARSIVHIWGVPAKQWSPPCMSIRNVILRSDGFAQDVPQGFVCIHIDRKKCYAVRGTQGDAATINLRCALHYLRNYGMECAGILFSPRKDGTRQTLALLEVGRSPLRDNPRRRWSRNHAPLSLALDVCM